MTSLRPMPPAPPSSEGSSRHDASAPAAGIVSFCDSTPGRPWRWEVVDPKTGATRTSGTAPTLEGARAAARRAGAAALELDIDQLLAAMGPPGRSPGS